MKTKEQLEDYRKGGIGALMDEYERAALELISLLENIGEDDYVRIVDPETEDSDCHSIQTMMNHVVHAGYGYADSIRRHFSIPHKPLGDERPQISKSDITTEIEKMLHYTAETLDGKWEMSYREMNGLIIYRTERFSENIEQLLEHAVMHILRHRRQVDKFMLQIEGEA
ncbi:MAG: hypothetical protein R2681_12320 [Pyrinomonadaceae bacterium]